jgi:hypothetical protein
VGVASQRGQDPLNTKGENIVGILCQATAGEDTASEDTRFNECCIEKLSEWINESFIIACSYGL